jgi:RNA polymerase sigma-70 factor (ECF subfamily)
MPHDTRAPTVRGAAPPSEDRLERWFVEMLPVVFGYCRARLSAPDAEDVTSEVFGSAAEQLRRDPGAELTRSWFLTAAHNRIVDRWRKEERWRRRMPLIAHDATRIDTATTDGIAESDALTALLDRLPVRQRAVLVLFYVEDRPVREIATMLDRAPAAIDSLLARARRTLH